jgi:hypothetical protein
MLMIDDDDGIKMFRVTIIISKLNPLYRGSFPQKSLLCMYMSQSGHYSFDIPGLFFSDGLFVVPNS